MLTKIVSSNSMKCEKTKKYYQIFQKDIRIQRRLKVKSVICYCIRTKTAKFFSKIEIIGILRI